VIGSAGVVTWSAQQYLAFEGERTRPVRDLLAAVPPVAARSALDLGCGPGNSTEVLVARFPGARASGIDSASDMIAAARTRLPAVRFEKADIRAWIETAPPASESVILANAVLHWLPDHETLFPALAGKLEAGGCLAAQMPDNLLEPAQIAMREIAAAGPWRDKLAKLGEVRTSIQPADWYHRLLRRHCSRVDVWRTTYYHPLAGAAAIVEWFKGSGLRPFLEALSPDEQSDYLARYLTRIEQCYPPSEDGTVLLPFPRLFIVAIR
jgi:trans-aconitate 2-methyltransferase